MTTVFFNPNPGLTFASKGKDDADGFIKEKKRIIYVAMSRPKHLLAMAFPQKISDEQLINKFGKDISTINLD